MAETCGTCGRELREHFGGLDCYVLSGQHAWSPMPDPDKPLFRTLKRDHCWPAERVAAAEDIERIACHPNVIEAAREFDLDNHDLARAVLAYDRALAGDDLRNTERAVAAVVALTTAEETER